MLNGKGLIRVDGLPDDTGSRSRHYAIFAALKAYTDMRNVEIVTRPARRNAIRQLMQSVGSGATLIDG
ncbi:MAG: hypothetical protein JG765_1827 [Cereibacter sp.]|jgi:hypothetical protein|nr:hypothetical protein [Cereibacter sp.]